METLKIQVPEGFKIDNFDKATGVVSFAPLPKDIKELVKSVKDACKLLGEDDADVCDYKAMKKLGVGDYILGNQELVIITKALNEGWTPNWTSGKYDKWFNWFDFNTDNEEGSSSSGRFSFFFSVYRSSAFGFGLRLSPLL